ncbi:hypothetical protein P3X46_006336 [Hevea brasiliensis]|uniref:Uncharacterized protein n=1 Tax=Hevea brasiliensis TaxID=3981 RepID=A0ABQ9MPW3_HEVBR|nr:uncharacterized protein LOC110657924 [Hevea brasiliensis]XP_021671065.2 uncharacterized protein LOC110657924 [Hevea brasiliensis]XP_058001192.1 uncharacterized protein LOC110657924 [Hevea brasiliensis]KAJ9182332.1 hypothetical protein P3X46_006336 [Hevea brasiliensis]
MLYQIERRFKMEDTFADAQKGGHARGDSSSNISNKDGGLSGDNSLDSESKLKRLVRRTNSQHALILKLKQLQHSRSYIRESFLRSIRVLESWIPKHMVTVDEKYLRRCLELIHISASKAAPSNISLNLGWGEMGILSDGLSPAKIETENTCDFTRFHFDCPLAPGNGSVVISPAGHWIVGSIMGSKSMVNILNSPLFHKYGAYDGDANYEKVSFSDVDGSTCYDFMNSLGVLSNYSSNKLCKEASVPGNHKYESETLHGRPASVSSTNSTCSDQSSSSLSAPVTQGMLQCTWKGGSPHFVFSLDDQKVVYVANLWKVESADDKAVDYTYLFHLRMGGQKEHEIHDSDSHLVGKMKVSTSFTLCPNKSRIMEREFVLFGGNENLLRMQTSSHDLKKSKGLSKKVAEVFRSSHSMKKRNTSRFSGSSAIMESCPWEPFQDTDNNVDALCGPNLLENHLPPNLELVAIVVKDHLPDNHQEKVGGWGLKFLKKSSVKQTDDLMESSQPHACSMRDTGDCSTSMDVLIPAGLHGGPRARNGGPSSLIERWRSGGCCDCGGWDLGCPLTVLKKRLSNKELSPQADIQGECKLVDLIIQGSENSAPPLRMVNVHNGLYFVNFQSTLSALQAFSIAVAFIHTQSPAFRPQNVQG